MLLLSNIHIRFNGVDDFIYHRYIFLLVFIKQLKRCLHFDGSVQELSNSRFFIKSLFLQNIVL